jgi:hypothetical protein
MNKETKKLIDAQIAKVFSAIDELDDMLTDEIKEWATNSETELAVEIVNVSDNLRDWANELEVA